MPTSLAIEINPFTDKEESPASAPTPKPLQRPADLAPVLLPPRRATLAPRKRWLPAYRALLAVVAAAGPAWPAAEDRPHLTAWVARRTRLRCLAGVPGFFVNDDGCLTFGGQEGWIPALDGGEIVLTSPVQEADAFVGVQSAAKERLGYDAPAGWGWTMPAAEEELRARWARHEAWIARHKEEWIARKKVERAAAAKVVDDGYRWGEWEEQAA